MNYTGNMKVSSLEINFKDEHRRSQQHCIAQLIATFCVEAIFYSIILISRPELCYTMLNRFVFDVFLNIAMAAISTSFVTLLHNLTMRYAALNAHLRLLLHSPITLNFSKLDLFFCRNVLKSEMHMFKKDAIHTFQFIGCQYGLLADIMHQLNHCYSFQVW